MSYWEALYGSQFWEIANQGKDGNKGRFNANLFLSAFIILTWLNVIMLSFLIPGFEESVNLSLSNMFGGMSGKAIGQLMAIPFLWIVYKVVSITVGSEENFKVHVDGFLQLPDNVKSMANKKILIPFLAQVFLLLIGAIFF